MILTYHISGMVLRWHSNDHTQMSNGPQMQMALRWASGGPQMGPRTGLIWLSCGPQMTKMTLNRSQTALGLHQMYRPTTRMTILASYTPQTSWGSEYEGVGTEGQGPFEDHLEGHYEVHIGLRQPSVYIKFVSGPSQMAIVCLIYPSDQPQTTLSPTDRRLFWSST